MIGELVRLGPWQVAGWWAVAAVGGGWCWIVFGQQHFRLVAERDLGWWLWHWFTGGPLEVHRVPVGPCAGVRAGIGTARTVGTVAFFAVLAVQVGTAGDLGQAVMHGAVGTVAAGAGTWLVVFGTMLTAHRMMWVRPLHKGVCRAAGFDVDDKARWYLTVPRDRTRDGVEFFVGVVEDFQHTDANQKKVIDLTRKKLGLGEERWSAHFEEKGRHNYCVFRPKEPMPTVVRFSDPEVRALVEKAKPSAPLFGIGRGGVPVYFDIDSDSPHVLLSTSTGGGKSWTIHNLTAQLMAKGAHVAVLDYKLISHTWVHYLQGDGVLRYEFEIEAIHDALVELGQEARRRYDMWKGVDLDDPEPQYPRLIIVCEELNATMNKLKAHWREIKPKGDTDMMGPAVGALRDILFMGRQVKVHIFAVAQYAIANDLGGPAARECFGIRLYVKTWSKQNWNTITPQHEFQAATGIDGRGFACAGSQAVETQYVMMTPHEARALVMEHRDLTVRPKGDVAVDADARFPGEQARHVADARQPEQPVELVTLWQASTDNGRGLIPMKYRALGKARDRDKPKGIFPTPVIPDPSRPQYDLRDLRRWHALRSPRGGDLVDVDDVDEVDPEDNEPVGGTEGPERMEGRRA